MTNTIATKTKTNAYLMLGSCIIDLIIILDQLSKWYVFERLLRHDGKGLDLGTWLVTRISADEIFARGEDVYRNIIVAPFLNIVMVWNKGVSFGLFSADGLFNKYALIVVALLVSGFMAFGLYRATRKPAAIAFALIIGGAIGNVIDRFRFGAVADFVDVHVNNWHWPAFNIADSAIVIGACLLVYDALTTPDASASPTKTDITS